MIIKQTAKVAFGGNALVITLYTLATTHTSTAVSVPRLSRCLG